MSNGPEEPDREVIALVKKLGPAPQRDAQAAANGKSRFLLEARVYKAAVSARHQQRRIERKENTMPRLRLPVPLIAIVLVGLVLVSLVGLSIRGGTMLMDRRAPALSSASVELFVAGQNIPQGAVITEDMLATISIPPDKVSAVEFTANKRSQLVGKIARFPLDQGTVITSAMLAQMSAPAMPAPQLPSPAQQPIHGTAIAIPPGAGYPGQMVVKNADIRLLVQDTDRALDGVTQAVANAQGYVISSRTGYQPSNEKNYKYATLTIGVPVDQFENTMRRLRSLAVQVLDENASGQDVTNQYVDLQSQLTNLEATQDRIRSFLDQATNVNDALLINQQLSQVEAQIEQIKGQMNYLSGRSAFSTITVNLEPQLPKVVATPRPTATPTPLAALGPWDAGKTTQQATYTLVAAYRLIASVLIWFFVVIVPIVGPPVLLVWLVMWLVRRRSRPEAKRQEA